MQRGIEGREGRGNLVLLYLCDFSGPSSISPVFAIRPGKGEGYAPSRVSPSKTLGLPPKANKRERGRFFYHLLSKRLPSSVR